MCVITAFSFLVCNLGLSVILAISVPILNAIYPVAIVLILLGLTHKLWKNNRFVYPCVVGGTAVVSVVYAMDSSEFVALLEKYLPLYSYGYGWIVVAVAMLFIGVFLSKRRAGKLSENQLPKQLEDRQEDETDSNFFAKKVEKENRGEIS